MAGLWVLEAFDDVFETACFEQMLVLHMLEFLLKFFLHVLHAVFHVQDSFDAGEVDAEVAHEPAYMGDALDVTVGIEARAVWAVAFARRGN